MTEKERWLTNSSRDSSQSQSVLQFLADPAAYPDPTTQVERIDTHISWVFLTDRFVYKMKKPVRFEFLDFSTLERRRAACEQEIHLNRRLAEDTYLELVAVTENRSSRFALAGSGDPVEWLVKMHRLPADRALDRLIAAGDLQEAQVEQLSEKLIRFYARRPGLQSLAQCYPDRIAAHIRGNESDLGSHTAVDADQLRRAIAPQKRLLRIAPELFTGRAEAGRVVDGHGDLRPEHVYFCPHPVVIDCIEFNDELRQIDVLDELSFLAVECERLSAAAVGRQVIDRYRERSGDSATPRLEAFYKSYRASVRAKVSVLRADQVDATDRPALLDDAQGYLALAERHAAAILPPLLLIVYGLSGTGKSTLADEIAGQLEVDHLSTDGLRHEMFGPERERSAPNQGRYTPENRSSVYEEMFRRSEARLSQRQSIVLDGTFSASEHRQAALDMAKQYAALPLLVHCHCPPQVALKRIASRIQQGGSDSDATAEIHRHQRETYGADPPAAPVLHIDTTAPPATAVRTVFTRLARQILQT